MSTTNINTQEQTMETLFNNFYSSKEQNEELEVRFGVKGKPITKIDFDNVIKYLLSQGFDISTQYQTLKIQNEYLDPNTGRNRISNIRCEILGSQNIQKYCKTNSVLDENGKLRKLIEFQQKKPIRDNEGNLIRFYDNPKFNFRVSYQNETKLSSTSGPIKQVLNDWNDRKKIFRLVSRYTLTRTTPDKNCVKVDVSIVKGSKRNRSNNMTPTYNIQDSQLFNNPHHYEIELEVIKNKLRDPQNDLGVLKNVVKYVLCGMQETNYPVGNDIQTDIKESYYKMINEKELEGFLRPSNFIGPSSVSLEIKNIAPVSEGSNIPNIRYPYSVTEKADGERKLLYIHNDGKMYLINTNMNVQFTGMYTKEKTHFNSILDGEHILYDKHGNYINTYASFDIYFISGKDQRTKQFMDIIEKSSLKNKFRLPLLQTFVKTLKPKKVSPKNIFNINVKVFEIVLLDKNEDFKKMDVKERVKLMNDNTQIFKSCRTILSKFKSGLYEYEVDGLIFTPLNTSVGGDYASDDTYNFKRTWDLSFKWKPPEFNTIDFLVTTKKDETDKEITQTIFENGKSTTTQQQLQKYKTLILMVGFDEKKHGYINPCNDVIQGNVPKPKDTFEKNNYRPMPFVPSNPPKKDAFICNMLLKPDSYGNEQMYIEDDSETFEDNTIVEFKYIKTNKDGWQWIPIRVRYDKTADYRAGLKNFGNAYHVAQSVWSSIHNPITEEMLMTGQNIPPIEDNDVYYNKSGRSQTRAMRDFHNLYVKRQLIFNMSSPGNKLYDLAVGKGGDFSKWISSKLRFVLGVDVSKDNIENRMDGACARFLNYKKQYNRMLDALFVNADSSKHILSGDAVYSDKGKQIINSVFGNGPKDKELLGEGVYKQYGIGKGGFDIVSCQFAIHYFFENTIKLHNFLRNVSEGCAVGGYFIGTCYDGKRVFNELRNIKQGESVTEFKNDQKIWEIRKEYDHEEFKDDETCIGYPIDVYQETINKMFREYLVNFDYLTRILKNYGFVHLSKEEANRSKLPSGIGSFSELYDQMNTKLQTNKRKKGIYKDLNNDYGEAGNLISETGEKRISFLNNYFVYKKVNDVDTKDIFNMFTSGKSSEEGKPVEVPKTSTKPKPKKRLKIRKKLVIKKKET